MKLSLEEKELLLKLSRESIEYYLDTKNYMPLRLIGELSDTTKDKLNQNIPLFVLIKTIKNSGSYVRGEAGVFDPDISLGDLIVQLSVHAAFFDPRTPRLKPFELNEVKLSLLFPSELIPINNDLFNAKKGLKADFRGRSTYMLPSMHDDFDSFEQVKNHIMLSLGAKAEFQSEVELAEFDIDELQE